MKCNCSKKYLFKKISSFSKSTGFNKIINTNIINNIDEISDLIIRRIEDKEPLMIARFGATELMCMVNYLGVKNGKPNIIRYLLGLELDWWWRDESLKQIKEWSGFYPANIENVEKFCILMEECSEYVDILASWLDNEIYFKDKLKNSINIKGLFLDPFWSITPWTSALKGKKVLVIHPFEEEIRIQYSKRKSLFNNNLVLPDFELNTIKAIQSLGGNCEGFNSWFNALDYMKNEIDKVEYDIALIGCGAYGFPLAAHIKNKGKKAIHMGGSLQLLFGIKGKRWENPKYGIKELKTKNNYNRLFNKHWIYPYKESRPNNAINIENGCYW